MNEMQKKYLQILANQSQKYAKSITHHAQITFIPRCKTNLTFK